MDTSATIYRILEDLKDQCIGVLVDARADPRAETEIEAIFCETAHRLIGVYMAPRIDLDRLYECLQPKMIPDQE